MADHLGLDEWFDSKQAYEVSSEKESSSRPSGTLGALVQRLNRLVCRSEVCAPEPEDGHLEAAREVHEYQALMELLTGDCASSSVDSHLLSLACAVLHNASKCDRLGLPLLLEHHKALVERARHVRSGPAWLAADLGRVRCSLAQRLLAEGDARGCQRMLAPLLRCLHRPTHTGFDSAGGRLRWVRLGDHASVRSLACLLAAQADYAVRGTCCPGLLEQVRCPALGPKLAYFRVLVGPDEKKLCAALCRWPQEASLWTLAGCRLASKGRWRSALQLLMHALRLDEQDPAAKKPREGLGSALWNVATCLGVLGLHEVQGRVLSCLSTLGDDISSELAFAAARALEQLGLHADAAQAYSTLLQRGDSGGDQALLRAQWSTCLLRAGRPQAALQACGKTSSDARLAFCRGSALGALGDTEAALRELRRGLSLAAAADETSGGGDWLHSQLLVNMAVLQAPRAEEASRRQLARALALCPGNVDAAYNLSLLLLASGKAGAAWKVWCQHGIREASEDVGGRSGSVGAEQVAWLKSRFSQCGIDVGVPPPPSGRGAAAAAQGEQDVEEALRGEVPGRQEGGVLHALGLHRGDVAAKQVSGGLQGQLHHETPRGLQAPLELAGLQQRHRARRTSGQPGNFEIFLGSATISEVPRRPSRAVSPSAIIKISLR